MDMVDAIKNLDASGIVTLTKLFERTKRLNSALEKTKKNLYKIGKQLDELSKKTVEIKFNIQLGDLEGIIEFINNLQNSIDGLWNQIKGVVSDIGNAVEALIQRIATPLDALIQAASINTIIVIAVEGEADVKEKIEETAKEAAKPLSIFKKGFTLVLKVKDGVTNTIKKVTASILSNIKVSELAKKALDLVGKGTMKRENTKLGMESAILQSNPNMNQQEAGAKSDAYMKTLKDSAFDSTFSEGEIFDAGSIALKAAKGDTGQAAEMVKLARDMAGSTGRPLEEAISALASAQEGSTDALKSFGVNASAEDLKKANGNILKMKGDSGKTMSESFKGGDEKAGDTLGGKINKLKGIGETILLDVASAGAEKISELLSMGIDFITKHKDTIQSIVATISSVIGGVFGVVISVINGLKFVFDAFMAYFQERKEQVINIFNLIMSIIAQLQVVWETVFPVIQEVLAAAWVIMEPVFDSIFTAIELLATVVNAVFKEAILPVIQEVYGFLEPLFKGIVEHITGIVETFSRLYNAIADFLKNFFQMDIPDVNAEGTTTVNHVTEQKGTPDNAFGRPSQRAVGIGYVPYDNYPALLHRGERVMTANENDQLRRNGNSGGISITIPKLAEVINASETGDVDKLLSRIEEKLLAVAGNMGVV